MPTGLKRKKYRPAEYSLIGEALLSKSRCSVSKKSSYVAKIQVKLSLASKNRRYQKVGTTTEQAERAGTTTKRTERPQNGPEQPKLPG